MHLPETSKQIASEVGAMREEKGQVLVETAFVLPLLLVLIFGMVDFGRAMYTKNTLNNAARSGARVAAVTPGLTPTSPAVALFSLNSQPAITVQNNIFNGIPTDNSVTYELTIRNAAGTSIPATVTTGDQVQINLTYPDFPMITPLYNILALITNSGAQGSNGPTITGQASMRYE
jgi:Flp pilus assembly protein TadG